MALTMPFALTACGKDSDINVRVDGDYIQWQLEGSDSWKNLLSVDEVKDMLGESYKGDAGAKGDTGAQGEKGEQGAKGEKGDQGLPGINGKEVEFRNNGVFIQWRYKDTNQGEDENWNNLVAIEEFKEKEEKPSYEGDVCSTVWKNYDGTVLYYKYNHGLNENPSYNGDVPVKPSPYGYPYVIYTFSNWVETAEFIDTTKGNVLHREYRATYSETLLTSGELKVIVDEVTYQYDFDNKYFVVTDFSSNNKIVAIPSDVNGVKVGGFNVYANSNICKKNVETILLPSSLEVISSIGYVPKLKQIVIPASVKRIETFAFYNEYNDSILEEVVFEEGSKLEYIGQSAFKNSPIKGITIPENVTELISGHLMVVLL